MSIIAPTRECHASKRRHGTCQEEASEKLACLNNNKIIDLKTLHEKFLSLKKDWELFCMKNQTKIIQGISTGYILHPVA